VHTSQKKQQRKKGLVEAFNLVVCYLAIAALSYNALGTFALKMKSLA